MALDLLAPIGSFASDAGATVHDAFNAMMSKVGGALSDAGQVKDAVGAGMSAPGNATQGVPGAFGNLGSTLAAGGAAGSPQINNDLPGWLTSAAWGVGHDLGAIGNAGDQIANSGPVKGAFAQGLNTLMPGANFTADNMQQAPFFGGVEKIAGNPLTYAGTGILGDALKGTAAGLKEIPALGDAAAPVLDLAQQTGELWARASRGTADAIVKNTINPAFNTIPTIAGKIPYIKNLVAQSSRAAVFRSKMDMVVQAERVFDPKNPTVGPQLERILNAAGSDLNPAEQEFQDTMNLLTERGHIPQSKIDALYDLPMDKAIPQLRDLAGQDAAREIIANEQLQRAAKAGFVNSTVAPAMDWFTNTWQKYITKNVQNFAAWGLNTPMFTLHLLSERLGIAGLNGIGPDMMSDADFLRAHGPGGGAPGELLNSARDPSIYTPLLGEEKTSSYYQGMGKGQPYLQQEARFTQRELDNAPKPTGLKAGMGKFLPFLKRAATTSFTDMARAADHQFALGIYDGMAYRNLMSLQGDFVRQHPEFKPVMDQIFSMPGTASTGLGAEPKTVRQVLYHVHDPENLLETDARFAESRDFLNEDVDSLLGRFPEAPPTLPGVVKQTIQQMRFSLRQYGAMPESTAAALPKVNIASPKRGVYTAQHADSGSFLNAMVQRDELGFPTGSLEVTGAGTNPEVRGQGRYRDLMQQVSAHALKEYPELDTVTGKLLGGPNGSPAKYRAQFASTRPNELNPEFTDTAINDVANAKRVVNTPSQFVGLKDFETRIRTELTNYNATKLYNEPKYMNTVLQHAVDGLEQHPDWIKAAPHEVMDTMKGLIHRYTSAFENFNWLAQRQTWSGMSPALKSKTWQEARDMAQWHLDNNGPLVKTLIDRYDEGMPTVTRFPGYNEALAHVREMWQDTHDSWQKYTTMLDEMGDPPRGNNAAYEAWWNDRVAKGNEIWNAHKVQRDALLRPLSPENISNLGVQARLWGQNYAKGERAKLKMDALNYFKQGNAYQAPNDPELIQKATNDANSFISDFKAMWQKNMSNDYGQQQAAAIRDIAQQAAALPPETRAAWGQTVTKAQQLATEQFHNMYVNPEGSMTVFDDVMRAVGFPFWTYDAQRWPRVARAFGSHVGALKAYINYYNNTDRGYTSWGAIPSQISFNKFGMQKVLGTAIDTAEGIGKWLTSGEPYDQAAVPARLPNTQLKNPVMRQLDFASQWASRVGFSNFASDLAVGLDKLVEHSSADNYGLLPGMVRLPMDAAAIPGTASWLPSPLRNLTEGAVSPFWAAHELASRMLGNSTYDYYVNQALANKGINWRNASEAQVEAAKKDVASWQTLSDMSGAVSYRPNWDTEHAMAVAEATAHGIPKTVVDDYQWSRNPTGILYARQADGSPYLDSQTLQTILQDHPEWHAWQDATYPLQSNEQQLIADKYQQLINDRQQYYKATETAAGIPTVIQKAMTPGSGVSGATVRDVLGKLSDERAKFNWFQSPQWSMLQKVGLKQTTPEDAAAQQYYGIDPGQLDPVTGNPIYIDPVTGEIDWDAVNAAKQALLDKMDPATKEYVLNRYNPANDYTDANLQATVEAKQSADKILQPYWQLGNSVWKSLTASMPGINEFKNIVQFKTALRAVAQKSGVDPNVVINQNPIITNYNSSLKNVQQAVRSLFPEIDLALTGWYDSKPVNPEMPALIGQHGLVGIFQNGTIDAIAQAGAARRASDPQLQAALQNQ